MARTRKRGGYYRGPKRKFIWHREAGGFQPSADPPAFGSDLLALFRDQPGATHLGATVMRVRGWIYPIVTDPPPQQELIAGLRVDTWDQAVDTNRVSPFQGFDEDWMAWFPYYNPEGIGTNVTGNIYASPFAVDVKANRKIEELNQTLWLFGSDSSGTSTSWIYNLSIGMKLA